MDARLAAARHQPAAILFCSISRVASAAAPGPRHAGPRRRRARGDDHRRAVRRRWSPSTGDRHGARVAPGTRPRWVQGGRRARPHRQRPGVGRLPSRRRDRAGTTPGGAAPPRPRTTPRAPPPGRVRPALTAAPREPRTRDHRGLVHPRSRPVAPCRPRRPRGADFGIVAGGVLFASDRVAGPPTWRSTSTAARRSSSSRGRRSGAEITPADPSTTPSRSSASASTARASPRPRSPARAATTSSSPCPVTPRRRPATWSASPRRCGSARCWSPARASTRLLQPTAEPSAVPSGRPRGATVEPGTTAEPGAEPTAEGATPTARHPRRRPEPPAPPPARAPSAPPVGPTAAAVPQPSAARHRPRPTTPAASRPRPTAGAVDAAPRRADGPPPSPPRSPTDPSDLTQITEEMRRRVPGARLHRPDRTSAGGHARDAADEPLVTCSTRRRRQVHPRPGRGRGRAHRRRAVRAAADPAGRHHRRVAVNLEFDGEGARQFARGHRAADRPAATPQNQFAIVLDGLVVSAPRTNQVIPDGKAEITGNFTQDQRSSSPTS